MEDYPDTRLMLTLLFRQHGYDVVAANSVEEARALSESQEFDLYLLDHIVGGDSGVDLCRQIRNHDSSTPICFYTGMAGMQYKKAAFDAGANAYVTKPAEVDKLMIVVSELLATKRA